LKSLPGFLMDDLKQLGLGFDAKVGRLRVVSKRNVEYESVEGEKSGINRTYHFLFWNQVC
jgi:hypothetical protein